MKISKLFSPCWRGCTGIGAAVLAVGVTTLSAQTIVNPSFETDTFTVAPGFINSNTPVTGWNLSNPARAGLNPGGGQNLFANNGTVPNGSNVLFMLTTNVASTVISGLTPATDYTVRFRVNSQNGTTPTLRVAVDNNPSIFDAGSVVSVGGTTPYKYVSFTLSATAESHTLYITNDATAVTAALLVDDLSVNVSTSGWSYASWSSDATSGVDSTKNYTHAYSFGAGAATTPFSLNGVTFTRIPNIDPRVNYQLMTAGMGGQATDASNVPKGSGGGSAILGNQFVHGGNPGFFTIHNLVPGKEYVATWYSAGWDPKAYGRAVTWMAGNDRMSINQDQFGNEAGIRVIYRYTAPATGFISVSNLPFSQPLGTFHIYGFSNYELTSESNPVVGVQPVNKVSLPGSSASFYVTAGGARPLYFQWLKDDAVLPNQTNRVLNLNNLNPFDLGQYSVVVSNSFGSVTSSAAGLTFAESGFANPSFEAEASQSWPGYISGSFPITGWFVSDTNRQGLNLIDGLSPFANNGAIPEGKTVAFLQNAGGVSNRISTFIQGLTPGQTYTLSFAVNARAGQKPNLHVSIDGQSISDILLSSVNGTNPYKRVAFDFVAANSTVTLALTNDAAGDTTALLDDFSIAPSTTKWSFAAWTNDASSGVDNTKFYTHALNFASTADAVINGITFRGTTGVNPTTPGYIATAGFGSLFANDVNVLTPNLDGSAVLAKDFLYGGPVQTITLTNLVPGIEYVATIYGVGFDPRAYGRAATFQVGNDRQTINLDHFGNDTGLRVSYQYTADASGSITLTAIPTDAGSTFHTYGFANSQLVGTAPIIAAQPQSAFVSVNELVNLFVALSAGAQPTTFQWQLGESDLPDQTNSVLSLSNMTVGAIGNYRVIVSNAFGVVTSQVATVEWGLPMKELFNTGVDENRVFLSGGQVDSHYRLVSSPDPFFPGPAAFVMHNGGYPLISDYMTNGLFSSWISPRTNSSVGNSNGYYIYRTTFLIDDLDPAHSQINGRWASDNEGIAILLNGAPVGSNLVSAAFRQFYPFTITNGFLLGSNVIDFVISNGPATGPTGLRVEMSGVGRPLPPTAPEILHQPVSLLAQEGGDAELSVVAFGSAPLTYQWYIGEIEWEFAMQDRTNRVLRFTQISKFDQAADYWVRISNAEGFTNSVLATLSVNGQPIANTDYVAAGSNQPVTFAGSKLLFNDTDAEEENDALNLIAVSPTSTNSGTVSLAGGLVTYAPASGFTGTDAFTYTLGDARGGRATGQVIVTVGASNYVSVVVPPTVLGNGHFQVGYSGVPGYVYTIERATNVLGPWQVFTNIVAGQDGLFSIEDDNTPPEPTRFYRVTYP